MKALKTLKEGLLTILSGMKEGIVLLGKGWKKLLRVLHEKLTGMPAEAQPTLFEVLAALHAVVSQLPTKQRRGVYIGSAALALVLVVGVGSLAVNGGGGSNGGGSNGGGIIHIGDHEYYQPEFSKLPCLTCGGDGDCNTCGGDGYTGFGDAKAGCRSCHGDGKCRACGGSGTR